MLRAGRRWLPDVRLGMERRLERLNPRVEPDERTPRAQPLRVAGRRIVDRELQLATLQRQLLQLVERREIAPRPFRRALTILVPHHRGVLQLRLRTPARDRQDVAALAIPTA